MANMDWTRKSFTLTKFLDRNATRELKAGDVLRPNGSIKNVNPFVDMVIMGFNEQGDTQVARPYVRAFSVGIIPTPMVWAEVFSIPLSQLTHYDVICDGYTG